MFFRKMHELPKYGIAILMIEGLSRATVSTEFRKSPAQRNVQHFQHLEIAFGFV